MFNGDGKHYCSRQCPAIHRTAQQTYMKRCIVCGATFRANKGRGRPQKTCSYECRGKATGKKRPITNGGDFRNIRPKILERDNHKCVLCEDTEGRLHVHHIDVDRDNNEPRNLLTLCNSCHCRAHSYDYEKDWRPLMELLVFAQGEISVDE